MTLEAKNVHVLFDILDIARNNNIPCALVTDKDHVIPGTAFTGQEIVTAVGIGPCLRHEVSHITKKLRLYSGQGG